MHLFEKKFFIRMFRNTKIFRNALPPFLIYYIFEPEIIIINKYLILIIDKFLKFGEVILIK